MNQTKSNAVQLVLANQTRLFHVLRFSQLLGYEHDFDCADIAKQVCAVVKTGKTIEFASQLQKYENIVADVLNFSYEFASQLQRALETPEKFGVDIVWRPTQISALTAIIHSFRNGVIRPITEIPTGIGKTMIEGVLLRCFYETANLFGINPKMLIVTSRVIIAEQMAFSDDEDDNEEMKLSDIALWFSEYDQDKLIRLLVGKHLSSKKQIEKDALITIISFQGLNENRLEILQTSSVGLSIIDESHNMTERSRLYLSKLTGYFFGTSATCVGAEMRSPFLFFETACANSILQNDGFIDYTKHLAYYAALSDCIEQGELKPIRWIRAKTQIDISRAQTIGSVFETFNMSSVEKILAKNPHLMIRVLEEVFLSDYPILDNISVHPAFRKAIGGAIPTVQIAKIYSELYNQRIAPQLRDKYGNEHHFAATWVDGTMDNSYVSRVLHQDLRNGDLSTVFSCKKIGEGMDEPSIDMVMLLGPLGLGSYWALKQLIGRGLRQNDNNPLADLLILDSVFCSKTHSLASVFGQFGVKPRFQGELLIGGVDRMNAEKKHLDYVMQGKSFKDALEMLSEHEKHYIKFEPYSYKNKESIAAIEHKIYDTSDWFQKLTLDEELQIKIHHGLSHRHSEVIKAAVQAIKKKGINSSILESYLVERNIKILLNREFEGFKTGKKMIQLVLQRSIKKFTPQIIKQFIDKLKEEGFDATTQQYSLDKSIDIVIPNQPDDDTAIHHNGQEHAEDDVPLLKLSQYDQIDNPIGNVTTFVLNNFGINAYFTHKETVYKKRAAFLVRCCIDIQGQTIKSEPFLSRTIKSAKKSSAKNLLEILEKKVQSGELISYISKQFQDEVKAFTALLEDHQIETVFDLQNEYASVCVKYGERVYTSEKHYFVHEKGRKSFALYDIRRQMVRDNILKDLYIQSEQQNAETSEYSIENSTANIVRIVYTGDQVSKNVICKLVVYKNGCVYLVTGEGKTKDDALLHATSLIDNYIFGQHVDENGDPISTLYHLSQKYHFSLVHESKMRGHKYDVITKAVFQKNKEKHICVAQGSAPSKKVAKKIAASNLLHKIYL